MIIVTSSSAGTRVELVCCLCHQRLTLGKAWLVFPSDAQGVEGKWVHEACSRGRLRQLVDGGRGVLMRGQAALSHLATSLTHE